MSCLHLSGILCSPRLVNWVSDTHNGQLICKLIQVATGCFDLQIWVTTSAELMYSPSRSLCMTHSHFCYWHLPGVTASCDQGVSRDPRRGVVSSVQRNYDADLAVQLLELCQPRPGDYCKISELLTSDRTMTGWPRRPQLYCTSFTGQGLEGNSEWSRRRDVTKVLSHGQKVSGMKKPPYVSAQTPAAEPVFTFNTAWHI